MRINDVSIFYEHCCGCGLCKSICSLNAISMKENKEGFLYPFIDKSRCVNCGKCVKICAFNKNEPIRDRNIYPVSYVARHKDEGIIKNSRSGGMFTAFSDCFLENGGIVYGCELINNTEAIHVRVSTKEHRNRLRGSKYIQSNITEIFKNVIEDLQLGFKVLFTGTSCQIDAIKKYVENKRLEENLFTIDILCYGVPSPRVWKDYIKFLENKFKKKAQKVEFRNKTDYSWESSVERVYFTNSHYDSTIYAELFGQKKILRKDCFACPYKNIFHPGDITIGDAWGVQTHYPNFYNSTGVSLVLINTEKGKKIFKEIKENILSIDVNLLKLMQPVLQGDWEEPEDRKYFWDFYNKNKFEKVLLKYTTYKKPLTFFDKVKIKCKLIIKRLKRK